MFRVVYSIRWTKPLFDTVNFLSYLLEGVNANNANSIHRLETLERLIAEFDARANSPLSLCQLARIRLRVQCASPDFGECVDRLPLPDFLKKYVIMAKESFEEEYEADFRSALQRINAVHQQALGSINS